MRRQWPKNETINKKKLTKNVYVCVCGRERQDERERERG